MSHAALLVHPDALETPGGNVLGRRVAGESFLRGFLRHAAVDRVWLWQSAGGDRGDLGAAIRRLGAEGRKAGGVAPFERARFRDAGVVHLPDPTLAKEAWARRPFGD